MVDYFGTFIPCIYLLTAISLAPGGTSVKLYVPNRIGNSAITGVRADLLSKALIRTAMVCSQPGRGAEVCEVPVVDVSPRRDMLLESEPSIH